MTTYDWTLACSACDNTRGAEGLPTVCDRCGQPWLVRYQRPAPTLAERAEVPPGRGTPPDHSWLRLVIHEGRKRQVRRMCEAVGHPVRSLVRVRLGDVVTGDVKPGQARPLSDDEVRSLRAAVGLE